MSWAYIVFNFFYAKHRVNSCILVLALESSLYEQQQVDVAY